jgi:hypothetical protein
VAQPETGPNESRQAAEPGRKPPHEVPMPGVSAKPCSRILQWLELESFGGKSDVTPIGQETFAVRRDEMCHRVTLPSMAVQPKSTVRLRRSSRRRAG